MVSNHEDISNKISYFLDLIAQKVLVCIVLSEEQYFTVYLYYSVCYSYQLMFTTSLMSSFHRRVSTDNEVQQR